MMSEEFDIEKYREEMPMDYFKAIELIKEDPSNPILANAIYKVTRIHIPDKIYKYYSLTADDMLNEAKLDTLLQQKVYLSKPSSFNDPFDTKAFFYKPENLMKFDILKECNGKIIDDFSKLSGIACFTRNGVNSMPMWAHYSNNHQGYCVEYDTNNKKNHLLKSCCLPVQYTDKRVDISNIMENIVEEILQLKAEAKKKNIKEIKVDNLLIIWVSMYYSLLKHKSWSYEKEIRLVINLPKVGKYTDAIPSAIYIGAKCHEMNKKKLFDIAYTLNIPIYQMELDEYSLEYELKPRKINS